jgi:hypothetical protein
LAQILRDTISLKDWLPRLDSPQVRPGYIYQVLEDYKPLAITANSLATDSATVRQNLGLFLDKLRYVKSVLTGNDLMRLGILPGPRLKEILRRLHEARLEGQVRSKREEEALVRDWLAS